MAIAIRRQASDVILKFLLPDGREVDWAAPSDKSELRQKCHDFFGLDFAPTAVCEGHSAPLDVLWEAYVADHSVVVWKACVPVDAPVLTMEGPRRADQIVAGTRLWSFADAVPVAAVVTDSWSSGKQKTLLLKTRAGQITCTPNHVLLVGRQVGWRRYEEAWIRADKVRSGDMVVRPLNFGHTQDVDQDLAEFAGLLLADGNVQHAKFLIAHHKDASYMPHYYEVVKRLFGKEMRRDDFTRCSWLHSTRAAEECRRLGLSGVAKTKRVPGWVFAADRKSKLAFLRGFLDGDGTVRRDGIEYFSCNRWLMEDVRSLALMAGLRVGRVNFSAQAGEAVVGDRVVQRGDMYGVHVYDSAEIGSHDMRYKFSSICPQESVWRGAQWTGHRVLSVEKGPTIETWDISVSGTEAFICDGYVVHNSRGFGGKSAMLATLGALCLLDQHDVSILGGSFQQAQRVHEINDEIWNHTVTIEGIGDVQGPLKRFLSSEPTVFTTRMAKGNWLRALTASTRSARGPHPTRLLFDEVDESDTLVLDAAMGQTMARRGLVPGTVLSSTHHYPDGLFTKVLERAAEKNWPVFEWCWRETAVENGGWLVPEEVERKRNEVTAEQFSVEYDLQAPSAEGRAIDTESVRWAFNSIHGYRDDKPGIYYEFEKPRPGARYATGADWAKAEDWTVIVTIRYDVQPARIVAFERRRRQPWPLMIEHFDARLVRFPGVAAHDVTGIGGVVEDYIKGNAAPFVMVGEARKNLFTDWIRAIEAHQVISPDIRSLTAAHLYVTNDDLFIAGPSGHPPDQLVAAALAWAAAQGKAYKVGHRPAKVHRGIRF